MPAKSKAQFRLMAGICNGIYPDGYRGISKQVACEFVSKTHSLKGLPNRKGAKQRYISMLKNKGR